MTYQELLEETEVKKHNAIREINAALKGPAGFLTKAEIERDPFKVAWSYLAREFCETLTEHIDEFIDQAGGIDSPEIQEIEEIYMAYQDGNPDLYDYLPVEARLFGERG